VSVPSGDALITLTMMGGYGQVVDPVSDVVLDTWLAQPEIDITVPLSEYWAFTGMARSGLHGWANDLPNGTVGGVFSFAQGNVGFSGGLNVLVGEYVGSDVRTVGIRGFSPDLGTTTVDGSTLANFEALSSSPPGGGSS
jgi:hypothetical protein